MAVCGQVWEPLKRQGGPGVYKLGLSSSSLPVLLINFYGNTATPIVYVLPKTAFILWGRSCLVETEHVLSAKMKGFTTWPCTEEFSNSWEEIRKLVRSEGQVRGKSAWSSNSVRLQSRALLWSRTAIILVKDGYGVWAGIKGTSDDWFLGEWQCGLVSNFSPTYEVGIRSGMWALSECKGAFVWMGEEMGGWKEG